MKAKEIIDKVKQTIELLIAPATGIAAVWGIDIAAYVAGGASIVISVLEYAKLFIKDKE